MWCLLDANYDINKSDILHPILAYIYKLSVTVESKPYTAFIFSQTIINSQTEPSMDTQTQILDTSAELNDEESVGQNSDTPLNFSTNDFSIIKSEDLEEKAQAEPLDLSLPKSSSCNGHTSVTIAVSNTKPSVPTQEEPLNLTSLKKDTLDGNTIYVTQSTTSPINIIATPLPTLVAIAEPGGIPCLRAAISTKQRTILIPQLSYTYTSPSTNGKANTTTTTTSSSNKTSSITTTPSTDTQGIVLNGCEVRKHATYQVKHYSYIFLMSKALLSNIVPCHITIRCS